MFSALQAAYTTMINGMNKLYLYEHQQPSFTSLLIHCSTVYCNVVKVNFKQFNTKLNSFYQISPRAHTVFTVLHNQK